MRDAEIGRHLDVVGRQRVIGRPHERVEVAPGLPWPRCEKNSRSSGVSTSRRGATGRLRTNAIAGAAAQSSSSGSAATSRARIDATTRASSAPAARSGLAIMRFAKALDAERPGAAGGGRGGFPFEETLAREPDADERQR